MNLDTHELAWAAGFFDGEGYIGTRKRKNWRELWFSVSQSGDTAPPILERFNRAIGGLGTIGGPWVPRVGMLPVYRLDLRGPVKVQAAVAMLWCYLSAVKRAQATKAMQECREYFARRAMLPRGRCVLTRTQVDNLRADYAKLKMIPGRQRVPRGSLSVLAARYGIANNNTVACIVSGRGYRSLIIQKGGGR